MNRDKKVEDPDNLWNLLHAVVFKTDLSIPKRLTPDVIAGILYALSTLDERERSILRMLYQENKLRPEIGTYFAISPEQVHQIENEALKKLRRPCRWNYIRYGIGGYLKKSCEYEYNRGYNLGYDVGYRNGARDALDGKERFRDDDGTLQLPIENMRISRYAYDCLKRAGYTRIRDVVGLSAKEIWQVRGMGKITANEIALVIREYGYIHTAWDAYLLQPAPTV